MSQTHDFVDPEPPRAEVDAISGPALIEFGTDWCGFCKAAQPLIAQAFTGHDAVKHVKVEDGKGRPLGRSFGITLWPTLVFVRDGHEVARLIRPGSAAAIGDAFAQIDAAA